MSKLTIEEEGRSSLYEILEDEVTIGRAATSGIQLQDRGASKQHGRVARAWGRWKYVDLESKNGTRVNGRYLNQHWLAPGDVLQIGNAVIRFDAEEGSAPVGRGARSAPRTAAAKSPVAVPPAATMPPAVSRARRGAKPAVAPKVPARKKIPAPIAHRQEIEEGGGHRKPRKRGLNTGLVLLLAGVGAIGFVVLMFAMMGGTGVANNQVFVDAERYIADEMDYAGAAAHARKFGEEGEPGWDRLEESIARWEMIAYDLAAQEEQNRAAQEWLDENLGQRVALARTPVPSDRLLPPAEVARLLRLFLREYRDTRPARLLASPRVGEPWETYRRILQEQATLHADVGPLLRDVEAATLELTSGRRYGEALAHWEHEKRIQTLLLQPESAQKFAERVDEKIRVLRELAHEAFTRDVAQVDALLGKGERVEALALLALMIETYGIDHLVRQAKAKRDRIG